MTSSAGVARTVALAATLMIAFAAFGGKNDKNRQDAFLRRAAAWSAPGTITVENNISIVPWIIDLIDGRGSQHLVCEPLFRETLSPQTHG